MGSDLVPARFVPQGEFDRIREPEFVIDDVKVIVYEKLGGAMG